MSNVIKIVATLRAKPGHGHTVEQALRACVPGSRAEAGCLFYDLHVDRTDPERFVFIEGWADMEAIEQHKTTAHYVTMVQAVGELLAHREVLLLAAVSIRASITPCSMTRRP